MFRACCLWLLLVVPVSSLAQGNEDIVVRDLTIRGNHAIPASQLTKIIATQETRGFLPWAPKRYFSRTQFESDLKRIEAFYTDRGYPEARVSDLDVQPNEAGDEVRITITIDEGEPVIVESVEFYGLDVLPPARANALRSRTPVKAGAPRDQALVNAARDTAARVLRNNGYPYAQVRALEGPGSGARRVTITFAAEPGTEAVFGPIRIAGNASVSDDVIRRQLTFTPGEKFRLGRLQESQRRLYGLELFQFAHVAEEESREQPQVIPIDVTLAEGKHRRIEAAVGYGSEEKARARFSWRHVNFLGGARTLGVETKWSSLDRGARLNFTEPYFFATGWSLTTTASQWWSDEPVYRQRESGGRVGVKRVVGTERSPLRPPVSTTLSATYIGEYEWYSIASFALEDPSYHDDLIALGFDPTTGEASGLLSALAFDVTHDTTARPLDRRRGYLVSAHLETAGALLGGAYTYREVSLDGRHFFMLGPRIVWANRVQIASLSADDTVDIPFFKRYFLGGSTSVRGWGRYELSPLSPAGLAVGGQSLLAASSELRIQLGGKLGLAAFVDAGNVWRDPWSFDLGGLRYAAGPGLRYDTPIGPIRFDVGFQLNPVPGLLVDGEPETRHWRLHLSIGQAF